MELASNAAVTAVIVAGGRGRRLGSHLPKPLVPLGSRPLVSYSLETFEHSSVISGIILVCGNDWIDEADRLGKEWAPTKLVRIVPGGAERADSVRAGLDALPDRCDTVAVHDAARPFVSGKLIAATISRLDAYQGVVPGLRLVDTLRLQEQGVSHGIRDRDRYVLTQTPQCFPKDVLVKALQLAREDGFTGTDDASYVERLPGARVAVVDGESANFKITGKEDLERARTMLEVGEPLDFRCGEGYDVHRFVPGRPLILGGVTIPFERGLEGHSDADVLCHAVGDALLGAAALGDLGRHFPDSDPDFKGISSLLLLNRIRELVTAQGYTVSNVDATLILEKPKITPHADEMIANLAEALGVKPGRVSVKATTTEGLGPEGRGESVSCRAIAGIRSIRQNS